MDVESKLWKIKYNFGNGYYVIQKASGVSRYVPYVDESFIIECTERQFDKYCRELFH